MGFFRRLFAGIGNFFARFFQAEVDVAENIHGIVANYQTGKQQIEDGIHRLQTFQFDPKWKNRVIHVPSAIQGFIDLYDEVFGDFRDRLGKIIEPVHELSLIFRAEPIVQDPQGGPSGLARTAVKIDEIATMIKQIKDATDTALTFTQAFDDVITNIEQLDVLFLPQGSLKTTVDISYRKRNA